jgi:hypothetical protein
MESLITKTLNFVAGCCDVLDYVEVLSHALLLGTHFESLPRTNLPLYPTIPLPSRLSPT